jgi:hypothetical protein
MVHKTQNHWVYGLYPSRGILKTKKQRFGNDLFLSSGEREVNTYSVGPPKSSVRTLFYSYLESRTVEGVHKPSDSVWYKKVFRAEFMGVSLLLFLKYRPKRS